jgi:hypothetical protein
MSDLIARLRQRAHLLEFRICGEAAEALEAAQRERDEVNRCYHDICDAWLRDWQTTHSKQPPADNEALTTSASRSAADRDQPDGNAFP